jgi:hypothetical protein
MFNYGFWNPLDKEIEVKRASLHPSLFNIKWLVLAEGIRQLKILCKGIGVKHLYSITPKWEGYLKRMEGTFKMVDMRILEVL